MRVLFVLSLMAVVGFANCQEFQSKRIGVGVREWKGMGYEKGYASANLFLAPSWTKAFSPFLDARAHVFNDGRFASNLGLGTRCAVTPNWALGVNSYYDFRDAKRLRAHQMGVGTEVLSPWIDFRVNGYIPVGDSYNKRPYRFDYFEGNNLFIKRKITSALPHIDGEVGVPIPGPFRVIDLYFGAGPYYLFKNGTLGDAWGAKTRLDAKVWDGVLAGVSFTYDDIYHGRFQGYVNFSWPFGPANMRTEGPRWKRRYSNCDALAKERARLTQPVVRDEIIPIDETTERLLAIDPDTGGPFFFIFVNNTSSSDGTFESPYPTMALAESNAQSGNIIYVFPGDGTTTGYSTGFVMKDHQMLVGSSSDFNLRNFVTIPALTPGQFPMITNTMGGANPGITLAQTNTVSGLEVVAAGIGIQGADVQTFTLINNRIRDCDFSGIVINGPSTTTTNCRGVIRHNFLTNNDLGPSQNEMFIAGGDGSAFSVARNEVIGDHLNQIPIFVELDGLSRASIRENDVVQAGMLGIVGFKRGAVAPESYFDIERNRGVDAGCGASTLLGAAPAVARLSYNTVYDISFFGVGINASSGAQTIGSLDNNVITGLTAQSGFLATTDVGGQVCVLNYFHNVNTAIISVDNPAADPAAIQITTNNGQLSGLQSANPGNQFSIGATDATFVLPGTPCP